MKDIFVGILVILSLGCEYQQPKCNYQELSSCEIMTNGDERYFTVMAKGQHLCCLAFTFPNENYSIEVIETTMYEWYEQMLNEHPKGPSCMLEDENCGPSWAYGKILK